jgi:hypothetical protein
MREAYWRGRFNSATRNRFGQEIADRRTERPRKDEGDPEQQSVIQTCLVVKALATTRMIPAVTSAP